MPEEELDDHASRPPTVLDRLVAAGIAEERARAWIMSGGARIGGEPVTDPDTSAPPPTRVVLYPA